MWARLAVIVVLAVNCVSGVWGQDGRSPRRYVPIPFDGDLEAMLRNRLADAADWEDFLKKIPPSLKRLAPQLERMKDDERFRDLLRMLKDQKLDKIAWPKNLQDFEKVIQKQIKKQVAPPVMPKPPPDGSPKAVAPMQLPTPPKPNPRPPRNDELETRFDRWVKDRLSDMESSNIGDMLRDSPAWQKTIEDLGRALGNIRPDGDGWNLRGVLEKWPLADNLKLPDLDKWLKPPNWKLPDLPRWQVAMPGLRIDNPLGGLQVPALPGTGSLSGGWQITLWLLAAAAAGFIVWQAWKSLERRNQRASDGSTPGPWPILPADVATRADLVACFDHLSLRLLGKSAEAWNHRTVAERLGAEETARRRIATDLATLYEWARYSPGDAPMPPENLAAARSALDYFARVPPIPAGK